MPQFFILNDSYQPGNTIKTFETLVWTERYRDTGDFQLVVDNEVSILQALPPGALVSHTDTREVMIVENHEIIRDTNKNLKVKVSGRNFETFAENRITLGSEMPLKYWDSSTPPALVDNVYTSAPMPSCDLAELLLKAGLEDGTAAPDDVVPNLAITMDMRVLDAAMSHAVERGELYSHVVNYLAICDAGFKTIRPITDGDPMSIVIHDGADNRETVIFYAQREDLEDAKYFWSIQGYKNYAQLAAETYARLYRHRDLSVDLTGLERRTLYVAADDIKGDYDPELASDVVSSRAQNELDKFKKISLLSARISKTARPKFKIDYDVGDLVTVFGEFATAQSMRITEHILTVDKQGSLGYPSLSVV